MPVDAAVTVDVIERDEKNLYVVYRTSKIKQRHRCRRHAPSPIASRTNPTMILRLCALTEHGVVDPRCGVKDRL